MTKKMCNRKNHNDHNNYKTIRSSSHYFCLRVNQGRSLNMAKPTRKTFNLNDSKRRKKPSPTTLSRIVCGLALLFVLNILFIACVFFQKNADAPLQTTPVKEPVTFNRSSSSNEAPLVTQSKEQELPKWVQDYISWHQEMRAKFPGKAIIEDPNAPPVLVRTCLGLCGGLHDRLGQLPLDLYLASQTKRILLIKWIKPQPLEEFLVPPSNGLDWVFPKGVEGWGTGCKKLNQCAKQIRAQPSIAGNIAGGREDVDLETLVDEGIRDLNGKLKNVKAVTYAILAHLSEDVLETRLKALGETDMIHGTASFGNIFRKFFQPHPNVQKEIDAVNKQYGLVPNEYTIAHCRVRHPKAYDPGTKFRGQFIANADKIGLPFEGLFKDSAVDIASRAISCAATMPDVENHPIYFMGDESALVTYMTRDLQDESYLKDHPNWFSDKNSSNSTALEVISKHHIVARDQDIPNAHIDKNKGRPVEAYYATFVDLYLGMNARCVSFGIGCYAIFAAKLSGTKCKVRYATEKWGTFDNIHSEEAQTCTLPERLQQK